MASKEMNEIRRRSHEAQGGLNYFLEVFGDHLAVRQGYKAHDGLEAVRFYLMEKYRWLPREVNSMSMDDLRFALAEELSGWSVPAEANL